MESLKKRFPLTAIVVFLYFLLILLDIKGFYSLSNYVKYFAMCVIFITALYGKEPLIVLALFLTLICDFFLLFTNKYIVGAAIFSLVHIVYIFLNSQKKGIAVIIPFAALPFIYLFNKTPIPSVYFFYAACFLTDIVIAFKNSLKIRPLFCAGLVLFALCDICVAVYNLLGIQTAFLLIWIFYTPSQLLIARSSAKV